MLSLKDIYWSAGFLDGEGSFQFIKNTARISAPQNSPEVLYKLQTFFGGHIYETPQLNNWSWFLYSNPAIGVMYTIYNLMSDKRKNEIKNVINLWRESKIVARRSRYKTHCKRGHEWKPNNLYYYAKGVTCGICRFGDRWPITTIKTFDHDPRNRPIKDSIQIRYNDSRLNNLYWAVGFWEAEGSVYFNKSGSFTISATQNSSQLLHKLKNLYSGNIYTYDNKASNWQLFGAQAVGLALTFYSIVSSKRKDQINKYLQEWKNRNISPQKAIELFGKCRNGHLWIDENIKYIGSSKLCKICFEQRTSDYFAQYYKDHKEHIKETTKKNILLRKKTQQTISPLEDK